VELGGWKQQGSGVTKITTERKIKLGKVATGYSETLEPFYDTTHCHDAEDSNLQYKELLPIMCLHYKQMTRQRRAVHYRVELGNVTKGNFLSL